LRANVRAALAALRADGLRVIMLTGDNATTAKAVAAAGNVRSYAKSDGTLSAATASGKISCSCGS